MLRKTHMWADIIRDIIRLIQINLFSKNGIIIDINTQSDGQIRVSILWSINCP